MEGRIGEAMRGQSKREHNDWQDMVQGRTCARICSISQLGSYSATHYGSKGFMHDAWPSVGCRNTMQDQLFHRKQEELIVNRKWGTYLDSSTDAVVMLGPGSVRKVAPPSSVTEEKRSNRTAFARDGVAGFDPRAGVGQGG